MAVNTTYLSFKRSVQSSTFEVQGIVDLRRLIVAKSCTTTVTGEKSANSIEYRLDSKANLEPRT